jgi:hypothetical protein
MTDGHSSTPGFSTRLTDVTRQDANQAIAAVEPSQLPAHPEGLVCRYSIEEQQRVADGHGRADQFGVRWRDRRAICICLGDPVAEHHKTEIG